MNNRVKEVRKAVNLTQSEFGKRIGISNTAVSKIEKGENNVSEQNIIAMHREFNVNEDWLKTGEGEMFLKLSRKDELVLWASTALNNESEQFRDRFIDALSVLDANDWELLANIAETLAKQKEKD